MHAQRLAAYLRPSTHRRACWVGDRCTVVASAHDVATVDVCLVVDADERDPDGGDVYRALTPTLNVRVHARDADEVLSALVDVGIAVEGAVADGAIVMRHWSDFWSPSTTEVSYQVGGVSDTVELPDPLPTRRRARRRMLAELAAGLHALVPAAEARDEATRTLLDRVVGDVSTTVEQRTRRHALAAALARHPDASVDELVVIADEAAARQLPAR